MEETLIGLEVAMLAKKKGFVVPCLDYYIQDEFENSSESKQNHNLMGSVYSRPTQGLLQKWLRETHGIYVESYHDYDPKDKGFQFYTNWGFYNTDTIEKKQSGGYEEYNDWKNYEDALEYGLLEALKLI